MPETRPGRRAAAIALAGAMAVCAHVLIAQNPPPQAAPAGRAVLAGRVVEAGTTQPVGGAVVTLGGAHTSTGNSVIFSFSQPAMPGGNRRTLTNAQGHFLFTDVPAGAYSIQVERSGYVPGGYGKARASGPPQTIQLGNEERLTDLSIPLSRFAAIVGRVLDEAGEPVIGVTVMANRRLYEYGVPQFSTAAAGLTDETDDRGEFRLATLVPGEYILSIRSTQATVPMSVVDAFRQATSAGTASDFTRDLRASGSPNVGATTGGLPVGAYFFLPASFGGRVPTTPPPTGADGPLLVYPLQFFPSARTPAEAEIIAVRSGETRAGIDFPLRPVATTTVSGVVTSPAGPIANLGLGLVIDSGALLSSTFFETATTVTDARGAFSFLGVPPGQYVLRSLKVPPAQVRTSPTGAITRSPEIPEGQTLWAQIPISVGRTAVTNLAVGLQTGFRISGRVEFDRPSRQPTPEEVARFAARTEVLDPRAAATMQVGDFFRLAADATGKLSSYQLPPGKYVVRVGPMPGWTLKSATVAGRDVSQLMLDLQGDVGHLVITFTDKPSSLVGTVRSQKGAPDETVTVLLFPAAALAPDFEGSMRSFQEIRPDARGAYRFADVAAGEYRVIAIPAADSGDFPSVAFVRRLASLATRVTIAPGEQTTQPLTTVVVR